MVNAGDYAILCNRMMNGEINEINEQNIKETCNLINIYYSKEEIQDMVNNNEIPDLFKLIKGYLEI